MSDPVRDRLLKVLRLAEQGIGGERANAEDLLAKLLAKHGMTRMELAVATEDLSLEWFAVEGDLHAQFIMAIAETAADRSLEFVQPNETNRTEIGTRLSHTERVSADLLLEVYLPKWRASIFEATVAFMVKNDITGVDEGKPDTPAPPPDPARAERIIAMAGIFERTARPRPRLNAGAP